MDKRGQKAWEAVVEAVAVMAVLAFFGMQIYYGYMYERSLSALLSHFLPVILLYAGMTMLQMYPEFLNGRNSEPLKGMVKIYAIRMARNAKLLLILGMLIPSAADLLGIEMNASYSIFIMMGILGNIGWYLYRIYQYNSKKKE